MNMHFDMIHKSTIEFIYLPIPVRAVGSGIFYAFTVSWSALEKLHQMFYAMAGYDVFVCVCA